MKRRIDELDAALDSDLDAQDKRFLSLRAQFEKLIVEAIEIKIPYFNSDGIEDTTSVFGIAGERELEGALTQLYENDDDSKLRLLMNYLNSDIASLSTKDNETFVKGLELRQSSISPPNPSADSKLMLLRAKAITQLQTIAKTLNNDLEDYIADNMADNLSKMKL